MTDTDTTWRSRALSLLLRTTRALPAGFARWLGGTAGYCFAALPGRDQRRCRDHLRLAFPEASSAWIEREACRCFRGMGRMALEDLATLHWPAARWRKRMRVEGAAHGRLAAAACRRGEGTVTVSGHLGNWELLGRIAGSVMPTTVVGRRLHYPELDRLLRAHRTAHGTGVLYQDDGARACLRELRAGKLLATLPDQDVGRLAGAFVPYFGRPAYTPTGPATLALLGRYAIQPIYCYARGSHWILHFGPRWRPEVTGDRERDAAMATARIMAYQEALLRRIGPWQWVWWHKRWRHAPADRPEAVVVG